MGKWVLTVDVTDVFHDEEKPYEERRDAIVGRLRESAWLDLRDPEGFERENLENLFDELSETADVDEFDSVWDAIYDEADYDRVWIATFKLAKTESH